MALSAKKVSNPCYIWSRNGEYLSMQPAAIQKLSIPVQLT